MSEQGLPYHRIAQRFFNSALWLQPAAAETIGAFLLTRIGAARAGGSGESDAGQSKQYFAPTSPDGQTAEFHSPRASRFVGKYAVDDSGRPLPYRRTDNGTAIITLVGELVNRGAWVGADSGLISYEGINHQVERATADPKTTHILLDLESPGGEAVGAFEAAAVVRAAAKIKPVTAIANGMAASAAYALASGASRIVVPPTGMVGSIGVVMVHLDFSEYLKLEGIKPTMIFSGAHKTDGNPFEPLPDSVRERFQQVSASFYAQFVETVAAGRAGLTDARIRSTEALMFKGQDAVDAGLADSVGTFEEVLAEISRGSTGRSLTSPIMKGSKMDKNEAATAGSTADQNANAMTLEQLQVTYPALCQQLSVNAAAAERQRIHAIDALPAKGHAVLIAGLKADGKSTAADAALAILNAEKATRTAAATEIAAVEGETGKVKPAASAQGGLEQASAPTDAAGWKAEFAASVDLQAEFAGDVDAYVSFKTAEASGKVRRLTRKSA